MATILPPILVSYLSCWYENSKRSFSSVILTAAAALGATLALNSGLKRLLIDISHPFFWTRLTNIPLISCLDKYPVFGVQYKRRAQSTYEGAR